MFENLTENQRKRLPNIVSGGADECLRDFIRQNYSSSEMKSCNFVPKEKPKKVIAKTKIGRKIDPESQFQVIKRLFEEGYNSYQIEEMTKFERRIINSAKTKISKTMTIAKTPKTVLLSCAICGKEFEYLKWRYYEGKEVACSGKCRHKLRRKDNKKTKRKRIEVNRNELQLHKNHTYGILPI